MLFYILGVIFFTTELSLSTFSLVFGCELLQNLSSKQSAMFFSDKQPPTKGAKWSLFSLYNRHQDCQKEFVSFSASSECRRSQALCFGARWATLMACLYGCKQHVGNLALASEVDVVTMEQARDFSQRKTPFPPELARRQRLTTYVGFCLFIQSGLY